MFAFRFLPRRLPRFTPLTALLLLTVVLPATTAFGGSPPPLPAGHEAPPAVVERIDELRREIARHDDLYFRLAEPEITDAEYDALKAELRRLEAEWPDIVTDAPPVPEIGDDRTGFFPTHRHIAPMLSLDKVTTEEELEAFDRRVRQALGRDAINYWVEPKFDGIAVSLTFENGRFTRAATRGNGEEGDDITANVRALGIVPEVLRRAVADGRAVPGPDLIEIRGELFASYEEFERLNAARVTEGERPFANPRNLAAGTMKLREPAEVAERRIELVCFGWGGFVPEDGRPADLRGFHEWLAAWGLPVVEEPEMMRGIEEAMAAVRRIGDERGELPFPIDGAVVKVAAVEDADVLGWSTTAPRWAVAWKFAPPRAATRLRGIAFQVGRTGAVTPVAELEPVEFEGATVERSSLHNADEIARLDLRIGDTVLVEKAGDIIPVIVGVDRAQRPEDSEPFAFPALCPSCGGPLHRQPGRAVHFCGNRECPERVARTIEHFASSAALNIRGLGPRTVEALVREAGVRSAVDLYRLDAETLLGVSGIGERTAANLLASIEASRGARWERVVYGLGLPGIGARRARSLAAAAVDYEALLDVDAERLVAGLDDGGAGLSASVVGDLLAELALPETRQLLKELRDAGVGSAPELSGTGPLAGEVVVVTGSLPDWTRAEVVALMEAAGAGVRSRVTGETTLLVAGERPGSNLERARALGVPVIDAAELRRRLEEN
ncbi:MAG: NAD-dependent DNA ligase LigA [Opitutales bacterium]|nr:NAD-dependent DNA ligase LigA [Opitutales bacterium]